MVANNLSPQSQMWARDTEKRIKALEDENKRLAGLISNSNIRLGSSMAMRQRIDGNHYVGHFGTMDQLRVAVPFPSAGDFATIGDSPLTPWYYDTQWFRPTYTNNTKAAVLGRSAGNDPYGTSGVEVEGVAIGQQAASSTTGFLGIAIGQLAATQSSNTEGIVIGDLSGYQMVGTAYTSIIVGNLAGYQTEGHEGISIGRMGAGNSVGFGSSGISLGWSAGAQSEYFGGTAIGEYAATQAKNMGSTVTFIGQQAGSNSEGNYAVSYIGKDAGRGITNSSDVVGLGSSVTAYSTDLGYVVAIGDQSMAYGGSFEGTRRIVAIGSSTVHLGATSSFSVPITDTVAVGDNALFLASPDSVAVGSGAAQYGGGATLVTAVGRNAGQQAMSAVNLTAIGANTLLGAGATTNVTALGTNAGYTDGTTSTVSELSYVTLLGANAQATVGNVFVMGSAISTERQTACLGNYDKLGSDVQGGFAVSDAIVVPTVTPTGGGILYVEAGALKYMGSAGTITTLGVA